MQDYSLKFVIFNMDRVPKTRVLANFKSALSCVVYSFNLTIIKNHETTNLTQKHICKKSNFRLG